MQLAHGSDFVVFARVWLRYILYLHWGNVLEILCNNELNTLSSSITGRKKELAYYQISRHEMDYIYAQYNILSSITQMKTVNVQCFLCKISIVSTTIKTKRIVFKFMLKVLISYYVLIHCKMGNWVNLWISRRKVDW